MFAIKNNKNEYLTKKNLYNDFSFTNNSNFAYVWGDIREAETVRNTLTDYQNITDLEIVTI